MKKNKWENKRQERRDRVLIAYCIVIGFLITVIFILLTMLIVFFIK